MGKWLAEFQDNVLETHSVVTDKTDKSPLMSVLSVQARGSLGEKTKISDESGISQFKSEQEEQAEKLIEASCRGLEITPAQFKAICSEEDLEEISAGSIPLEELRTYARSFAEGILSRRIVFHPKTNVLIHHN